MNLEVTNAATAALSADLLIAEAIWEAGSELLKARDEVRAAGGGASLREIDLQRVALSERFVKVAIKVSRGFRDDGQPALAKGWAEAAAKQEHVAKTLSENLAR